MLSQIADAMNYPNTGVQTGLANPTPADRAGFCAGGCVIISHSTGALLTDAAMALANETKTNLALRTTLGNIGYIPDHMRAHIAQHGAFSGSNYATAMVGAALPLANPATCTLALLIANNVFGGSFTSCGGGPYTFQQSVLFDLIPQVTQTIWGPWINKTPVVTLTTSGGHPTSVGVEASWAGAKALTFLKPLLHRGFDDGVTAGNGACANPNPESDWPSGFVAKSSPLDVAPNAAAALAGLVTPVVRKVYDMGNPLRGIPFYIDQVIDRRYAPGGPTRTTPYFVAGECTPYVAPDGMVQPVAQLKTAAMWGSSPTNPLARYNNHYSYLMSTSDHYYGPRGPYPSTCYEKTSVASLASTCLGSNQDNTEEVRVITDNFVYTSGLVNPAMKNMVVESVKGKRLPKLCKHCKKRWIWKRVYHKLVGSDTLVEDDYVYNYVLR
jgi:hypothetical protein